VAGHRFRINLDETQGAEFVRRLAEDEAFYNEFKANPQKVLADNNVDVAGPMTPTAADVPPQEEIQQLVATADSGVTLAEGAIEPAGHPVFKLLFAFPFSADE
jgi:hypothetical protein